MEKLRDTATECHLPYGITQSYLPSALLSPQLPNTGPHVARCGCPNDCFAPICFWLCPHARGVHAIDRWKQDASWKKLGGGSENQPTGGIRIGTIQTYEYSLHLDLLSGITYSVDSTGGAYLSAS